MPKTTRRLGKKDKTQLKLQQQQQLQQKQNDEEEQEKQHVSLRFSEDESDGSESEIDFLEDFEKMKEKDPEFFKFLQNQDQELLNNIENDKNLMEEDNDDESDDEIDDDNEKEVDAREDERENIQKDNTANDHDDDDAIDNASSTVLSMKQIEKWEIDITKSKHRGSVVKKVCSSFNAVLTNPEFQTSSGDAFNRLMILALTKVPFALKEIFSDTTRQGSSSSSSSSKVPTASKKWKLYHKSVRTFLKGVIELLGGKISEPTILVFVLKELEASINLVAAFPKLVKPFIRSLLGHWAGQNEQVQLFAFLALQSIAKSIKSSSSSSSTSASSSNIFEITLKLMYLEFMRRCKYLNAHNKDRIQFMLNCLLEVYSLDAKVSYTLAFGYIRQMANILRTALTNLSKEKIQAVYNWQFLRCLEFWGKLLAVLRNESPSIETLIYPLSQVALGSISLQKSPQYFPFHLQVVSILNELSRKCGILIPLSQFLVSMMEDCDCGAKKNSMAKMLDLRMVVKVTKAVSQSRLYKESVISECLDILVDHHASVCTLSASYPESAYVTLKQLRSLAKKNKSIKTCSKSSSKVRMVISKLQEQVNVDLKDRPNQISAKFDRQAFPLEEFNENCHKMRLQKVLQEISGGNHGSSME